MLMTETLKLNLVHSLIRLFIHLFVHLTPFLYRPFDAFEQEF